MTQIVTQNGIANSNIVFASEYRRKVFYREKKRYDIEEICPDSIRLLLRIPPKMSVSGGWEI